MSTSDPEKQQYLLDQLVTQVSDLRRKLDQLVFTILVLTLFAATHFTVEGIDEVPVLSFIIPNNNTHYNLLMAAILYMTFAVIGSLLIDYFKKRALLDRYYNELIQSAGIEAPSEVLVRSSFYEYLYQLDQNWKNLRLPGAVLVLVLFYASSFTAMAQLLAALEEVWIGGVLCAVYTLLTFLLYRAFVVSVVAAKPSLKRIMIRLLLVTLGLVVAVLGLYFLVEGVW